MTQTRIIQDPTASVRTRTALAQIAKFIAKFISETATFTISLTSGVGVHTVTVTGAVVGDTVTVSPTTTPHASVASWSAFVSSADTVTIRILISGGPGGTASQAFRVTVIGY